MKLKKALLLVLCAVLLVAASVMGTVAYLQDSTDAVVNTFTVGEVQITLTETPNDGDEWTAKLIPGKEYTKDPVVTVLGGSEDCWLFIEIVETNEPQKYLDFAYDLDGWTPLSGETGVYYREVEQSAADQPWSLIAGDKVTVKSGIVNPDAALGANEVNMPAADKAPTISFTAYAIQKEGFTSAAAAWAQVK